MHKRPRVLHLIVGLGFGGAEVMLERLIRADGGSREHWVVGLMDDYSGVAEDTYTDRLLRVGAHPIGLGMPRGRPTIAGVRKLVRIVRDVRPDLVVGWMYHGNFIASLLRGTALVRAPVVWNVRCALQDAPSTSRVTIALVRLGATLGRSARAIVYNSALAAEQHEAIGYPAERTRVVPNGFETNRFAPDRESRARWRARLGVAAETPLVGIVARSDRLKDHPTFVAAATRLLASRRDVRFVLAGRGMDTLCSDPAIVAALAGSDPTRFSWLGHVSDVPGLLNALDVHVLCSTSEGFPNAVGEAMACGIPCVTTDVGDARHLVGDTGEVVPARDPAALSAAIARLLDMGPSDRAARGNAGRQRILANFSVEAAYAAFDAIWRTASE